MRKNILVTILLLMLTNVAYSYTYEEYLEKNRVQHAATYNDFNEYVQKINDKIQKNWQSPEFSKTEYTHVLFTIDNEGYVISAKILESSHNPLHDDSAIYALQKAEPFGTFPTNTSKTSLTLNYNFETKPVNSTKAQQYLDLSDKYFAQQDYKQALAYINNALEEFTPNEKSYIVLEKRAKIYKALGNYQKAEEDLTEFYRLKQISDIKRVHFVKHFAEVENTPFAYFYLSMCYEQVKDYKNAITAIDKAISMSQLNNAYKRYKEQLVKQSQQ